MPTGAALIPPLLLAVGPPLHAPHVTHFSKFLPLTLSVPRDVCVCVCVCVLRIYRVCVLHKKLCPAFRSSLWGDVLRHRLKRASSWARLEPNAPCPTGHLKPAQV